MAATGKQTYRGYMMTESFRGPQSIDAFDEQPDSSVDVTDFDRLVAEHISRRGLLGGLVTFGTSALVLGSSAIPGPARAATRASLPEFNAVPANTLDTVTVPQGYSWRTVVRWGDPMWSGVPEFDERTRGTAASQARSFGDNNDGMALFTRNGRSVLAVNNEFTNRFGMFGNRTSFLPETDDDVDKSKAGHGVSIIEISDAGGDWSMVKDSPLNRRITPDTPMSLTGPAAGHDLLRTAADPEGKLALGTWNNCGNGRTPWGTYLTCEENFNLYFSASGQNWTPDAGQERYGLRDEDRGYGWARTDERFDISKHPNEPNRAGYIVEIDPLDPASTPRKRTALGRFKHENAELVIAGDGHVVVYMGDDERGEFLYRYVSRDKFAEGADNNGLLEDGSLHVARFADDGTGEWIELTPEATGMTKAEICVFTRMAASKVGATTMDRPEWIAANPHKAEAYCCLTNNKYRGIRPNAGGDPTPVNGPNPREMNNYGQIVRWLPDNDDHTAAGFRWNLYVMCGNPAVHTDANAGSDNVTVDNMFNAPDGLAFDSMGRLWIQTDGNHSDKGDFAGMGNNQMLVGDPGSGEIHRFLVGPKECEVTGLTWSADRRTMFVGIQHPGTRGKSHFPDGGNSLARSAVIAVTRDDGGRIG